MKIELEEGGAVRRSELPSPNSVTEKRLVLGSMKQKPSQ